MKLRISSCKAAALKKDVTRFAPAWALYSVMLAFIFYILCRNCIPGVFMAQDLLSTTPMFAPIHFCYALLVAQLLFGYLFDSRSCNSLHAFPLRRESWFAVHVAAGVLFSLVPNGVFALLQMLLCGDWFHVSLLWLAIQTLEYLFFFGLAVLCMLLVGNRFGGIVAYGGLSFLSMLVWCVAEVLFVPMMYGVELTEEWFLVLCPVWALCSIAEPAYIRHMDSVHRLVLDPGSWIYLGVLAVLGLVLLGLALVLYRRRQLECAGDFVAEKWLRPVFLTLYSLFAGTLLAAFMILAYGDDGLGAAIVWILIGMAIGVITGRMLLQRTVRVFDKSTLRSYGALVALMIAILLLFRIDAFGIRRYVPETEDVQSVEVQISGQQGEYTQPEDVEKVLALHRYMVDAYDTRPDSMGNLYLTYTMKNGTTVARQYALPAVLVDPNHPCWDLLKAVTFQPEFILGTEFGMLDTVIIQRIEGWSVDGKEEILVYSQDYPRLAAALMQDVEEGNLLPAYVERFNWWDEEWTYQLQLKFLVPGQDYSSYHHVYLTDSAKNTMEILQSLQKQK